MHNNVSIEYDTSRTNIQFASRIVSTGNLNIFINNQRINTAFIQGINERLSFDNNGITIISLLLFS